MRETFSLFVTLEMGAEDKTHYGKAIKSQEGGGKRAESAGAHRAQVRSLGIAASPAALHCGL